MSTLISQVASAAPSCRSVVEDSSRQTSTGQLTEQQIVDSINKSKSYQDKRNKQWLEQRKCLCCHTTLPYMLSRGLDSKSRANFNKLKEMAEEKVENPAAEPWYHADHAGRNSKPTEAVLNALTLLMYDISNRSELSTNTLKSMNRIFETMDADGHLHWLDYNLQPFESKKSELWGNSMALLTIEMAKKHSNYQPPSEYTKLKAYMLKNVSKLKPHEMSVMLWANSMASSNRLLKPGLAKFFADKIRNSQNENGSWNQKTVLGQGENKQNIYTTAISFIGLIKAGQGNTQAAHKAAKWLSDQQQTGDFLEMGDGTTLWNATSMNRVGSLLNDTFASDAATSYSALALQIYKSEVLSIP
ncbi:MAG: hypothetical protein AABY53_01190 [Bdellovibrionota bacterium]